jgi:ABC-2 type transport system ATP-binding protein
MIDARDLSKHYGDKLAVDHLSFTVEPGQVTGFLGRTAQASRPRCG